MSSKNELLANMNPRQKEAVMHAEGPLLLMAEPVVAKRGS